MIPPPAQDRHLYQLCLGAMSARVPQLREAVHRRDEPVVRGLARELRHTVGLLGLPRLFRLSQDIEYQMPGPDPEIWHSHCHRFCDLLENIQWSLQQKLLAN